MARPSRAGPGCDRERVRVGWCGCGRLGPPRSGLRCRPRVGSGSRRDGRLARSPVAQAGLADRRSLRSAQRGCDFSLIAPRRGRTGSWDKGEARGKKRGPVGSPGCGRYSRPWGYGEVASGRRAIVQLGPPRGSVALGDCGGAGSGLGPAQPGYPAGLNSFRRRSPARAGPNQVVTADRRSAGPVSGSRSRRSRWLVWLWATWATADWVAAPGAGPDPVVTADRRSAGRCRVVAGRRSRWLVWLWATWATADWVAAPGAGPYPVVMADCRSAGRCR